MKKKNSSNKNTLQIKPGMILGKIGPAFNAQTVTDFGCAFGALVGKGPVVVGRDGRETGEHYARSVISAMNSQGLDVYALGIVPSATLAVAARELKCSGAISITPGAMPEAYSGLKFYDNDGHLLTGERFTRLEEIYRKSAFRHVGASRVGKFKMDYSCLGRHIQRVTEIPAINLMDINRAQMKVVVDCGNAGGSALVPSFLRCVGVSVTEVDCSAGPGMSRVPDIRPAQLEKLQREVRRSRADLGVAVDADGSRIGLVDEKGRIVPLERTLELCLMQAFKAHGGAVGVAKSGLRILKKRLREAEIAVWEAPDEESSALAALNRKNRPAAVNAQGDLWYKYGTGTADALVTLSLALSWLASSREPMSKLAK